MSEAKTTKTILGPDCKMEGDLSMDGDGQILGRFKGDIRAKGALEVAESATVSGTIVANTVRVAGVVKADVIAEGGVDMLAGGRLSGRLFSTRISICEGGEYEGQINVGPQAMQAAMQWVKRLEQERASRQDAEQTGVDLAAADEATPQPEAPARSADVQVDTSVIGSILSQRRGKAPAVAAALADAADDSDRAAG